MSDEDLPDDATAQEMQVLMRRVLAAEQDKLHMKNPRGIINDLERIIKEEIQ